MTVEQKKTQHIHTKETPKQTNKKPTHIEIISEIGRGA